MLDTIILLLKYQVVNSHFEPHGYNKPTNHNKNFYISNNISLTRVIISSHSNSLDNYSAGTRDRGKIVLCTIYQVKKI